MRWITFETRGREFAGALQAAVATAGLGLDNITQLHLVIDEADECAVRDQLADVFGGAPPPCHLVRQGVPGGQHVGGLVWLYPGEVGRAAGVASVGSGPARVHFLDAVGSRDADTSTQWRQCFDRLAVTLNQAGLGMANLVKLWTYYSRSDGEAHFPAFSAYRNQLFAAVDFTAGLPASTGVRTRQQESLLGAIAATGAAARAVSNPLQADPASYRPPMRPALFSRGVGVPLDGDTLLLASGTASVVGSSIAHEGDPGAQAGQVLDLLDALANAAAGSGQVRYGYFLAYVRDPADAALVRGTLRARCPDVPTLVIQADLSRPSLLVEIDSAACVRASPAEGRSS